MQTNGFWKRRILGGKVFKAFTSELKLVLRYSQLFPLCFAVFVSMLGFGLVMPLLPIYARSFGATGTQLGFLTASFAITRAATTFPGGWFADRAGRKKPILIGLLTYSVVMTLYGFSTDISQLILLRALQGTASGIVWPVMSTMVADMVKPEDRGKAMGLYEMMWFMGTVVGPGLGGVLADLFNAAVPFFVCGGMAFVAWILVAFTVKETIGEVKAATVPPSVANSPVSPERNQASEGNPPKPAVPLTLYPVVFIGICIAQFVLAFSNSLIQPILSVYANERLGISEGGVGMLFTTMALVTLVTTFPMGVTADRIGRKKTLVLGKSLDAVSALLVVLSGSFWPLLGVMMLRGFGRAAINPSITAMFTSIVSGAKRGRAMGILSMFQNVGLIVGSTFGGFLFEVSSKETPFFTCSLVGLTGVVVVLLMVSEPGRKSAKKQPETKSQAPSDSC